MYVLSLQALRVFVASQEAVDGSTTLTLVVVHLRRVKTNVDGQLGSSADYRWHTLGIQPVSPVSVPGCQP